MTFRTHQCFVRQRIQLINALRGHLAEFGLVFPQGPAHLKQISVLLEDGTIEIPDTVREIARLYLDHIDLLTVKIDDLTLRLRDATQENVEMRRLCTVPGLGPVISIADLIVASDKDSANRPDNMTIPSDGDLCDNCLASRATPLRVRTGSRTRPTPI